MKWREYSENFDSLLCTEGSTFFHKYISLSSSKFIVFIAYKLRLTPNQLTLLSSIFIIIGMISIYFPYDKVLLGLINLFFLQFGFILDCADGILARLINKPSKFGAFFDIFLDRVNNFIVFILFGLEWFLHYDLHPDLDHVLLYIISACAYIIFTMLMLIQGFIFKEAKGTMQRYGNNLLEKLAKLPYQFMNMGIHFFILSLAYIFGLIFYVVVLYGILSVTLSLAIIIYLYVQGKDNV